MYVLRSQERVFIFGMYKNGGKMKYNTREFRTIIVGAERNPLFIDERADSFSEEFFKELYQKSQEGIREINIDKDDIDSMYENDFYKEFEEEFRRLLPQKVLDRVADIRVLALGYVSPRNYKIITKYQKKRRKYIDKVFNRSNRCFLFHRIFLPKQLWDVHFHDSEIISATRSGNDLILEMELYSVFWDREDSRGKFIFHDYKILEQDNPGFPSYVDDVEIYKTLHGFEFHFLLPCIDEKYNYFYYFTIACKRIEIA